MAAGGRVPGRGGREIEQRERNRGRKEKAGEREKEGEIEGEGERNIDREGGGETELSVY